MSKPRWQANSTVLFLAILLCAGIFFAQAHQALACECYTSDGLGQSTDETSYCQSLCSDANAVELDTGGACDCPTTGESITIDCASRCEDAGLLSENPTAAATTTNFNEYKFATPILSVPIPNLTFTSAIRSNTQISSNFIGEYVSAFYRYLVGIATTIAIVFLMIGGLQYVLAAGTGETTKAKTRIQNAVVGLLLVLFTYVILYTVNPRLVEFQPLSLTVIDGVHIDNETPTNFTEAFKVVATPGDKGRGWNDVVMYDQKQYANVAYGPESCKTTEIGNIKSSGCGVTSFAMVASTLANVALTPDLVAPVFYSEGFRPINKTTGCGENGTVFTAYFKTKLLDTYGLRGRAISTENHDEILSLLGQNKLVIVSYRTDSGGGHFVVLTGLDDDGNIEVNNPYGGKMELRSPEWLWSRIKSAVYVDTTDAFISG